MKNGQFNYTRFVNTFLILLTVLFLIDIQALMAQDNINLDPNPLRFEKTN